jgi:hypothetical protein
MHGGLSGTLLMYHTDGMHNLPLTVYNFQTVYPLFLYAHVNEKESKLTVQAKLYL